MISAAFIRVDDIFEAHAAEDQASEMGDRRSAEDHFERGVAMIDAAATQEPMTREEAFEQLKLAIWLWQFCDLDTRGDALALLAEAQAEIETNGITGLALNRVRRVLEISTNYVPAAQALIGFWNSTARMQAI